MSNEPYSPATRRTGILVLGLGNVLLGDDGLGAAAVARLEAEYSVPPDVQLADGGTLGLSLLGLLTEADHATSSTRFAPTGRPARWFGSTERTSAMRCAIVFRPTKLGLPICWTLRV